MELKRSPQVARPVEAGKAPSRWPWVVGIVVIVLILVAGGVIGYVMWQQRSQPTEPTTNTTNNTTNETPEPGEPTEPSTIKDVDPEDLTRVVYGTYADAEERTGTLTIKAGEIDGDLVTEETLLEVAMLDTTEFSNASISPNGQFVAVTEQTSTQALESTSRVRLIEVATGKETVIAKDEPFASQVVWGDDSRLAHFSTFVGEENGAGSVELVTYDLESADVTRRPMEVEGAFGPVAVRGSDLFGVAFAPNSDGVGALLRYSLRSDELLTGETVLDAGESRGFEVSADGSLVVNTTGEFGEGIGPGEGPFTVELVEVETGDVTTLRTSDTEMYAGPHFTPDGDSIVYNALSGIWRLDLDTEERTQLIESDEDPDEPVVSIASVMPDGSTLAVTATSGERLGEPTLYLVPIDAEAASILDFVGLPDVRRADVLGWGE